MRWDAHNRQGRPVPPAWTQVVLSQDSLLARSYMGKKDKQRHLDDGGAGGEKLSKKQKREEQTPGVGKASAAQAAPTVCDNLPVTRMTQHVLRRPLWG